MSDELQHEQFAKWSRSRLLFENIAQTYAHYLEKLVNFNLQEVTDQTVLIRDLAKEVFGNSIDIKPHEELDFQTTAHAIESLQPEHVKKAMFFYINCPNEVQIEELDMSMPLLGSNKYTHEARTIINNLLRGDVSLEDTEGIKLVIDTLILQYQKHYKEHEAELTLKGKDIIITPSPTGGNSGGPSTGNNFN